MRASRLAYAAEGAGSPETMRGAGMPGYAGMPSFALPSPEKDSRAASAMRESEEKTGRSGASPVACGNDAIS